MPNQRQLNQHAKTLASVMKSRDTRIVFAESCTGGLVSAALTRVPGISDYHCGSAVVYRIDTKTRWLNVPGELLVKPGPVSNVVARHMAEGVLRHTPEADVAASITGHLGPNAPPGQDGLIFVGVARRSQRSISTLIRRHRLDAPPTSLSVAQARAKRQTAAAIFVLRTVAEVLEC